MWATTRVSGRQVACHIGDREKVSPKSFGFRIRDPANSEIPIEVVKPHMGIGVSAYRESGISEASDFRHHKC
jgi:hypothetical protein